MRVLGAAVVVVFHDIIRVNTSETKLRSGDWEDPAVRGMSGGVDVPENTSSRRRWKDWIPRKLPEGIIDALAMVALFLPWNPPLVCIFLGLILVSIGHYGSFHHLLDAISYVPGWFLVIAGAFAVPFWTNTRKGDEPGGVTLLVRYAAVFVSLWVVLGGAAFLVALVTHGPGFISAFKDPFAGKDIWGRTLLLVAVPWLVVGVPDQAFKLRLDRKGKGNAQRVLVRFIVLLSCVLTAIYLFLLHLTGGPLSKIPQDQLNIDVVVTVLLVAPFYNALAKLCWRWGITGFVSPKAWQIWPRTATEVGKAMKEFLK